MKTEPQNFSINDLKNSANSQTDWDGVRNYQARNFMRDEMKIGDLVFIYHSSCKNIGIAGLATVVKESHPDLSALDPTSPYFDLKSSKEEPRWFLVTVKWLETFNEIIPLKELKNTTSLSQMHLVKKGSRLSIQPVKESEYKIIMNNLNKS